MSARDNFKKPVKDLLAKRVGYKCSNPFCRITTIGAQQGGSGTVNIGEAAHIYAAAPGGKRHNPSMTSEERESYENGIWLCRTHAAMIDRDEKFFTVEMLQEWKESAEKQSSMEIMGVAKNISACKVRIRVFYKDLLECREGIFLMKRRRGAIINPSCMPVQRNWEANIMDIVDMIGLDIASELLRIFQEIEEMKSVMQKELDRTKGKWVADRESILYCQRYDLFMERMDSWLTDEFMEILGIFIDI